MSRPDLVVVAAFLSVGAFYLLLGGLFVAWFGGVR